MKNLARTEWLKLRRYKAFWWMTAIVGLSYPGINYIFYRGYLEALKENKTIGGILKMMGDPFTFPEVWHTVAYGSSFFIFIPAIVVIMFITNEYTFKTHRQNIIDGWSRKQFMAAKMMDVILVTLMITLIYFILSIVIGYLNISRSNGDVWGMTKYIGLFFLQTFSQLSLAFLIAFLVRKAFLALGIFIFYWLILENAMERYASFNLNDIGRYLPFEISDRLIPVPAFLGRIRPESYEAAVSAINRHVGYTLLLTAATWGLCFWLNNRRDL
jgi:ABC-2 type transport system permease protein